MDIKEALLFADQVFYSQTEKHLDDIQLGVLEGVLKRKKYSEIAEELRCTEGYVKDIGYDLWRIFSDYFGENIGKSNFKSVLLRYSITDSFNLNIFGSFDNGNVVGSFNFCQPQEESMDFLRGKQKAKLELIFNLRKAGLTDDQIAKCLDMNLEDISDILKGL